MLVPKLSRFQTKGKSHNMTCERTLVQMNCLKTDCLYNIKGGSCSHVAPIIYIGPRNNSSDCNTYKTEDTPTEFNCDKCSDTGYIKDFIETEKGALPLIVEIKCGCI